MQRVASLEAMLGRIERLVTELHATVQNRDGQCSRATSERLDAAPQAGKRTLDEGFAALTAADGLTNSGSLFEPLLSSLP